MIKTMMIAMAFGVSLSAFATPSQGSHQMEMGKIGCYTPERSDALFRLQRQKNIKVVVIRHQFGPEIPAADAMKSGCNTEHQPIEPVQNDKATATTEEYVEGTGASS